MIEKSLRKRRVSFERAIELVKAGKKFYVNLSTYRKAKRLDGQTFIKDNGGMGEIKINGSLIPIPKIHGIYPTE